VELVARQTHLSGDTLMLHSRSPLAGVLACVVVAAAGCSSDGGGDTTPSAELVLAIFAGATQSGTVGAAVATPPAVKVTDDDGDPQAGVDVAFSVTGGGGSIVGATQTTDAEGVARVGSWNLGNIAGANTLRASVDGATGSPVTFTATGIAGAAAAVAKLAGDAITSAAGLAVSAKPSVKVTDQFGNGVSGVAVTFAVASGGGSATGTSQTTAADGSATVGSWTLGTGLGANTMTATAAGLQTPATFTITAVAGPVASIVKLAGDNQTGIVGALLGIAPSVRVADQFGNDIAGQNVTFAIGQGGGSVTGGTQTSNASGVATAGGWTLGATPGANTLTATAATFTVTFTANATAAFNALQYAGTYAGTWQNTTFGSVGTGNAIVTVNELASTATATVTVTGPVLGTGGVITSANGAYTSSGVTFNTDVPPMGIVSATLSPTGSVTATGTNVPAPGIDSWSATGTLTATSLNLTFTVNFSGGGPPATGTITLTK
jgi:adhesin/invasin